jgi:hypothetical protein
VDFIRNIEKSVKISEDQELPGSNSLGLLPSCILVKTQSLPASKLLALDSDSEGAVLVPGMLVVYTMEVNVLRENRSSVKNK